MRKFNITNQINEDQQSSLEISVFEKMLAESELITESEEIEEYNDVIITSFTFEDGSIPKRNGEIGSINQFEAAFGNNERIFTSKNIHGYNVFICTANKTVDAMGYIVMNTREFIQENPGSLYDTWVDLLDEINPR